MIQLSDISLNFGSRQLFENLKFSIRPGSRTALIGPNGSGKTTLLNILAGEEENFQGERMLPAAYSLGYLKQEFTEEATALPLLDTVLAGRADIIALEAEMAELEEEISRSHDEADMLRYSELQDEFRHNEGYEIEAKAKAILGGLGFFPDDFNRPLAEFSGGWRMRVAMAKLLLKNPSLLLLDEPTNHLDLDTLVWFENFLVSYSGTIVMVSHDRYFLDRLSTDVADLSGHRLRMYRGNYSFYEEQKALEIRQLQSQIKAQERKRRQTEAFIERFRYKATKARQVQSRIKMLEKQQILTLDSKSSSIRFNFPAPRRSGDPVVYVKDLYFAYPGHKVFQGIDMEIRRGDRIALTGLNGSGKTTLLKLLTAELKPKETESLRFGQHLSTAYFAQQQLQLLDAENTVMQEISEHVSGLTVTEIRNHLGAFLFSGEDVDKKIAVLSGGEKSRLVLLKMLLSRSNFLILDEPTNHLDMDSREVLAEALDNFAGTILIVSHDRFFLDMLVRKIYHIEKGQLRFFDGNYSEFVEDLAREKLLKREEKQPAASGEKGDLKQKKRREAEIRQKKYALKKDKLAEMQRLDKEIPSLQQEKDRILQTMAGPEYLQTPIEERKKIDQNYKMLLQQLDHAENRWLELSEFIENIDNSEI